MHKLYQCIVIIFACLFAALIALGALITGEATLFDPEKAKETLGDFAGDAGAMHAAPELIGDWFFDVKVTGDTGMDAYYIAKDYSAVYHIKDGTPTLVYGSAKNMMAQETVTVEERNFATEEENAQGIVGMDAPLEIHDPLVKAVLEPWYVAIGTTAEVLAESPGMLPFSVTVSSSDNSVAAVNADGSVTFKKAGQAVLKAVVTIDDATREYDLPVTLPEPSFFIQMPDSIEVGESFELNAVMQGLEPEPPLSFTVDDAQVLALNGNSAQGLRDGTAVITIAAQGVAGYDNTVEHYVMVGTGGELELEDSRPIWPLIIGALALLAIGAVIFIVYRLKKKKSNQ